MAAAWVLGGGAATVALTAWLAARRPTWLLGLVLATFATGPEWILAAHAPASLLAWSTPIQMLLLAAALVVNGFHFGLRLGMVNWPLLAALWLLVQSLVLAALEPAITSRALVVAALGFVLPWCLVHFALEPGSRIGYARLVALLPALCIAAGAILDVMGAYTLFSGSDDRGDRLRGASNAGWLAFLGFVGFAIAAHEAIRRRDVTFAGLAAANLLIVLLSGGRMALLACAVLSVGYVALTPALRTPTGLLGLLAAGAAVAVLVVAGGLELPIQELTEQNGQLLDPNGRGRLWRHYLEEVRASPLFGHGLGAAERASLYHGLPHNGYLRLLVDAGVLGAAAYLTAVVLWARRVVRLFGPSERGFVAALLLALAIYAVTDNILLMPAGLIPFFYLAVLRTPRARRGRRRRHRQRPPLPHPVEQPAGTT
jgi:O-antigen ligase